jgi:hypothetical protein
VKRLFLLTVVAMTLFVATTRTWAQASGTTFKLAVNPHSPPALATHRPTSHQRQ